MGEFPEEKLLRMPQEEPRFCFFIGILEILQKRMGNYTFCDPEGERRRPRRGLQGPQEKHRTAQLGPRGGPGEKQKRPRRVPGQPHESQRSPKREAWSPCVSEKQTQNETTSLPKVNFTLVPIRTKVKVQETM